MEAAIIRETQSECRLEQKGAQSPKRPRSWGTLKLLFSSKHNESKQKMIKEEDFELGVVIGRGSYSSVRLAKKIDTGERFAIKQIRRNEKDMKEERRARSEALIMAHVRGSPFVLRVLYTYQNKVDRFLVLDYFEGGSLQTQLELTYFSDRRKACFAETRAKFHAAELLLALRHMHSRHVCHRDLKLSNVLMRADGHIALADFGLARLNVEPHRFPCQTFCGTVEYLAPEILKGEKYGLAVDFWAFAIAVFEMLFGRTPFFHSSPRQMFTWILRKPFSECYSTTALSNTLLDFLSTASLILQKSPAARLAQAEHIFITPWFNSIDFNAMQTLSIPPPFKPTLLPLDDDDDDDDEDFDTTSASILPVAPAEKRSLSTLKTPLPPDVPVKQHNDQSFITDAPNKDIFTQGRGRAFIFLTNANKKELHDTYCCLHRTLSPLKETQTRGIECMRPFRTISSRSL